MESIRSSLRDSDSSFAQGFSAMFSLPNNGVPRRTILVKRSKYSAEENRQRGILRASHARGVQFNMDQTAVHEFEKVSPAERNLVWYNTAEETEMARLAAPRSSIRKLYDAVLSVMPTAGGTANSGTQFGGGGLFGDPYASSHPTTDDDGNDDDDGTNDNAATAKHSKFAYAKDELAMKSPTRLSIDQNRRQRIVEDNQNVILRAMIMLGFLLLMIGSAAWNIPPPKPKSDNNNHATPATVPPIVTTMEDTIQPSPTTNKSKETKPSPEL